MANFEIYTAHASERILKRRKLKKEDFFDYTLRAAKGGHVSFQIIAAAKKALRDYSVRIGRFKNEKGVASGCSVTVYCEKYLEVERPSSGSEIYPAGLYPDALIPYELIPKAEKYLAEGENQGFFVSVSIPEKIQAGKYIAEFSFAAEKEKISGKISLIIYDVNLPQTSGCGSCYCLRYDLIEDGEGKCDWNIRKKYYDFLLDYRINAYSLPLESMDGKKFAEIVRQYYFHPKFTSYGIPCDIYGSPKQNVGDMLPLILGLAEKSTEKLDLFSKAYCYFYDEPEEGNHIESDLVVISLFHKMLEKAVCVIEKDRSGIYDEFKKAENWKERIRKIRVLGTIYLDCASAEIQELTDIWVPSYISFDSPNTRKKGMALAEYLHAEVWWYGCMGPHYPYPTYHLTDRLLSCRTIAWMQRHYGVKGHLYWLVNGFRYLGEENSEQAKHFDVFRNAHRREDFPAGDGLLLYPSARYRGEAPFPSMRLENLREGLEDYELLGLLEKHYMEYAKEYDGFSAASASERFYSLLFTGMMSRSDPEEFEIVREELLETLADKESGFVAGACKREGNRIVLEIFVREGAEVCAEHPFSAEKNRYIFYIPVHKGRTFFECAVRMNDKIYKKRILVGTAYDLLCDIPFRVFPKLFSLSCGSSLKAVNYGKNSPLGFGRAAQFSLFAEAGKCAEIRMPFTDWKIELTAIKRIRFDMANAESRSLTMFISLYDKTGNDYPEQAKEFFADSSCAVIVEYAKMKEIFPEIDFTGISVRIRNTYPKDEERRMSVFLNYLSAEY